MSASAYGTWRLAFLPTIVLLGFALPITFLTSVEQLLYYLRPMELIPTFGTAWLFMAVLCMPCSIIFGLLLKRTNASSGWNRARKGLVYILFAVAGTEMAAAFANGVVVWLRSFGFLSQVHVIDALSIGSLVMGCVLGLMPAGRGVLLKYHASAKTAAILGALSLLSMPFFGWRNASDDDSTASAQAEGSRPNILLVTIDALSAEHMSLYGGSRRTTPNLDEFASRSTVFDHAYSNGNFTTPGIASILTATRPWTHRALQLQAWSTDSARGGSLPAMLKRAGYQMAYVGTSPWAGATRNGLGAYFNFRKTDEFTNLGACRDGLSGIFPYDCPATQLAPFTFLGMLFTKAWLLVFDKPPNWQWDPREAVGPALQWLAGADKSTPIFLWVHLMPPHSPYAAPAPWLGQFNATNVARLAIDSESEEAYLFSKITKDRANVLEARYDESISYVDHFAGELLKQSLRLLGNNTMIVLTADHGESFTHGYGMHRGPGLYQSIIHIPLIIKMPHQAVGARTAVAAEQIDIAPTMAELAGFAPSPTWEGHPLQPVLGKLPPQDAPSAPVFSMNFEENRGRAALTTGSIAVIDGNWKLVHYMGPLRYRLMPQLIDTLYDLLSDPNENVNRIFEYPEQAQHLQRLIDEQLVRHGAALP